MVHTACHELGHALGLPHHTETGELMHFLGLGGGEIQSQSRTSYGKSYVLHLFLFARQWMCEALNAVCTTLKAMMAMHPNPHNLLFLLRRILSCALIFGGSS